MRIGDDNEADDDDDGGNDNEDGECYKNNWRKLATLKTISFAPRDFAHMKF